jgi:hypothetical protein
MQIAAAGQVSAIGLTAILIALIGACATVYVGVLNYRTQKEGLKRQKEQGETQLYQVSQQIDLIRAGQVTQRFTSAVEQLGNKNLDVRIGGIYALEGIAGTDEYRRQITEVIAAYVQGHAPWPPTMPLRPGQPPESRSYVHFPPLRSWAPDVQTAMTVLARRKSTPADEKINLARVDLRGAELSHAKLSRALLRHSSLMRAILNHADLSKVDFARSILERSDLRNADLRGAILSGARLTYADLGGAQLGNAKLDGTDLSMVIHGGTDFRGATANKRTQWPEGFDPESHGIKILPS